MLCMATAGAAEHGARPIPIVTATKTMTMAGMRYVMDRFASCVGFTPSFSGDSLQPAGLRHGKRCVLQESIGLFLLVCQGNSYRRAAEGAALWHGGCRPRGDLGSGARRRSQVGHKLPCSSRKRLFERERRSSYNVTRLVPMIDGSTHSIRIAKPSDSDAVSALLEASYSTLLAARYDHEMLGRALPLMTRANPTLLASGTYYIAESDQGNLVGCGGWTTARPGGGEIIEGEAHIRHFATHPEWVGRGIGTSLLARCFSDARPLGIRKLHCFPH
jgi:GNAT superfamily N-acetyltransferase